MSNVRTDTRHREIIFHDDDETPLEFILELLHSVFKKPLADAVRFTDAIRQEKASCGSYPRKIADELLEAAQQRIDESGHPLRITSRSTPADARLFSAKCKLCDNLFGNNKLSLKDRVTRVCDECMDGITRQLPPIVSERQFEYAYQALSSHFNGIPLGSAGRDLATVPKPHARRRSSRYRQNVLRVPIAVFRHLRAKPL